MSDTERDPTLAGCAAVSGTLLDARKHKVCPENDAEGASGPVHATDADFEGNDLDELNDNVQDLADDNLSLEVNFGDDSSCRASDVSSLSFQNIALEDPDNPDSDPTMDIVFHRRSGSLSESSDSPLNDFPAEEDPEIFSGRLEQEIKRRKQSETSEDGPPDSPGDRLDHEESSNTGTMKRRNKAATLSTSSSASPEHFPAASSPSAPTNPASRSNSHCLPAPVETSRLGDGCFGSPTNHFQHAQPPANNSRYLPVFQDKAPAGSDAFSDGLPSSLGAGLVPVDDTTPTASSDPLASSVTSDTPTSDISMDTPPSTGRNSLEIRNNIPQSGEVKSCHGDEGLTRGPASTVLPKVRKKSPGLARRLYQDNSSNSGNDLHIERDTMSSGSEADGHKTETAASLENQHRETTRIGRNLSAAGSDAAPPPSVTDGGPRGGSDNATPPPSVTDGGPRGGSDKLSTEHALDNKKSDSFEKMCDSLLGNEPVANGAGEQTLSDAQKVASMEVENEYDYIKYARIQHGDSYVGMRLAFSTSSEELSHGKRQAPAGPGAVEELYLGSSRENSPEKLSQLRQAEVTKELLRMAATVSEDAMTEIPLNTVPEHTLGGDGAGPSDPADRRNFSLSPEATECDSAEVESVLSEEVGEEEGRSSNSGMPAVEDGLSSSQGSDAEDSAAPEDLAPSEILRRRYKAEMKQQGLPNPTQQALPDAQRSENNNAGGSSLHSTPSRLSEGRSEEEDDIDSAIRDIKSAIELSKQKASAQGANTSHGIGLDDTSHGGHENHNQEPVWVMRDSYVRKIGNHDDLKHVRDEYQKHHQGSLSQDQEHVFHGEEGQEDLDGGHSPNKYSYSRHGNKTYSSGKDYDTDEETDELLDKQYSRSEKVDIPELTRPPINKTVQPEKQCSRAREVTLRDPDNDTVLIEGVLFRARYLGSTQLISEGQPSKALRMMQAQEAVGRIKAPEGENQPSTEVDLFVSIEKIMVLNTDLQEIMMDHALRTISYIADIGDILVIMARRGPVMPNQSDDDPNKKRQTKICCHVFESDEAQLIAQSIGQAFQVAYMEFLKANGIDDPSMFKEIDYQEVLNQQEIFGEELFLFSNKEMQKEVIVPKAKNEPLGVVIVESGWGSMVPTVVLANMSPSGAAARCGQLNIGDQIMSINGVSLVGLPLSSCQSYIKAAKNQTVVKLNVVSCAPVVEVCIKRPDVKYQLGFSVQNGVICSLLRGGIAERGGVRVGHRIIEINSESVVAVPHEKIVKMLATSVGEIHMKTMPTSIFRLLTGQDTPHYI